MKKRFFDITESYLNAKQRRIIKKYMIAIKKAGSKINGCLVKSAIDDFFSRPGKKTKSATADEKLISTCQTKYIRLFLMMYLGYLNKLVDNSLPRIFGSNWRDKNTGYIISIEKTVMDNVFSSKNNLQKLLSESGILPKLDDCRKTQVITRGERVLSAIQQKLRLKLSLQSYFVVAQLHQTYIQVTLHQVVKIKSPEENETTIMIQDKVIPIENVVDAMCKNIWNQMKLLGGIDYCTSHKNEEYSSCNLYSLQNYSDVLEKLKIHISETVSTRILYYYNTIIHCLIFFSSILVYIEQKKFGYGRKKTYRN